jgi:hypothetical protein
MLNDDGLFDGENNQPAVASSGATAPGKTGAIAFTREGKKKSNRLFDLGLQWTDAK